MNHDEGASKWATYLCREAYYDAALRPYLANIEGLFRMGLHGDVRSYAACDTLQVKDYSRYDMAYFDEESKRSHRDRQFPADLAECFRLGAELSRDETK